MSVLRKSLLSVFGTGIVAATNVVIGILLARWLLPEGLGQYGLVAAAGTIAGVVLSLGLGKAAIYYVNRLGFDRVEAATGITAYVAPLALLLFAALFVFLGQESFFGRLTIPGRAGGALYGAGQLAVAAALPILVTDMEIRRYVVVQLTPNLALMLFLGSAAVWDVLDLDLALLLAGGAQAAGAMLLWWFLRDRIDPKRLNAWRAIGPIVKYGMLLNLSYIVHLLVSEGGLFLVRALAAGFDEVGFYKVGVRIGSVILMGVTAVSPLLYSKFSTADVENRRLHVERTSRVFWTVITSAAAALAIAAEPVVRILLGTEYLPAVPVLRVLLVGMVARALAAPMLNLFTSSGAPLLVSGITGLGLVVMVGAMLWLVPSDGATGAALAFSAGNLIALVTTYFVSRARFGVDLGRCFLVTGKDVRFIASNLGFQRASEAA